MLFSKKLSGVVMGMLAILLGGTGFSVALAAGVIDDAPTLATAFFRMLDFLLKIFGFLVILSLTVAGILYFTAGGSTARLEVAKKAFSWAIVGVVVGLGALVLVRALATFFE